MSETTISSIALHKLKMDDHIATAAETSAYVDNRLSTKIFTRDPDRGIISDDWANTLSVIKIDKYDFDTAVGNDTLMSGNILYIISSDYMDAYGQQLCNLTMSDVSGYEYEGIAVTKPYVDEQLCGKADKGIVTKIIAPAHVSAENYTSSDYVTNNDRLYKCNISANGIFVLSDWIDCTGDLVKTAEATSRTIRKNINTALSGLSIGEASAQTKIEDIYNALANLKNIV